MLFFDFMISSAFLENSLLGPCGGWSSKGQIISKKPQPSSGNSSGEG